MWDLLNFFFGHFIKEYGDSTAISLNVSEDASNGFADRDQSFSPISSYLGIGNKHDYSNTPRAW